MLRIAYIHQRLRNLTDYPSCSVIAAALLDRYGEVVSTKTIQRDINWMRDEGAPIVYDAKRHGFFYTDDSWTLPAISLTGGDLMALMVADRALASYRNSPYYSELKSVFDRLTDLLPERVTVASEDLAGDVTVIAEPVTRIDDDVWRNLRTAMSRSRSVVLQYQAPGYDTPAVRVVDPLHIVGHRGEWYLLSWSHHNRQVRIYALARIKSAKIHDATFERPDGFSVDDYIDPSFGVFVNETAVGVAVRFDGVAASKIRERRWHPEQTVEELGDGSIVVRFRTNQQSQVLFWVSQWGPQAEVLEPPELRDRAGRWFAETASRYN
jgi:proteasome accessory factor B